MASQNCRGASRSESDGPLDGRARYPRRRRAIDVGNGAGVSPRDCGIRFTFVVPRDMLLEKVVGANVRGWKTTPDGETVRVDVTLLKSAIGTEKVTLLLSKRAAIGEGAMAAFAAPVVSVAGRSAASGNSGGTAQPTAGSSRGRQHWSEPCRCERTRSRRGAGQCDRRQSAGHSPISNVSLCGHAVHTCGWRRLRTWKRRLSKCNRCSRSPIVKAYSNHV